MCDGFQFEANRMKILHGLLQVGIRVHLFVKYLADKLMSTFSTIFHSFVYYFRIKYSELHLFIHDLKVRFFFYTFYCFD